MQRQKSPLATRCPTIAQVAFQGLDGKPVGQAHKHAAGAKGGGSERYGLW